MESEPHTCKTHEEWLRRVHYMCSCGHVEWAHYGPRLDKGRCAHCHCTQYKGETRPLTDYEKSCVSSLVRKVEDAAVAARSELVAEAVELCQKLSALVKP